MVRALADGTIDNIATDHAPHGLIDKEVGFDTAAFGVVGLETALPVLLKLVHDKKISLKRLIELLTNGLKVLRKEYHGLKRQAPADIAIFDINEKCLVSAGSFYSKGRNTPFDGWKLKGKVKYTIVGGVTVFDHEKGISGFVGR